MPLKSLAIIASAFLFSAWTEGNAAAPAEHSSKVRGVALWRLEGISTVSQLFYSDTEQEFKSKVHADPFFAHCDGRRQIYIRELPAKGFICKTEMEGSYSYRIQVSGVTATLNGVYTVSIAKLKEPSWLAKRLDDTETQNARAIAKKHPKLPPTGVDYEYYPAVGRYEEYEKKITVGAKELLLIPTTVDEGASTILFSAVLLRKGASYRFIGHIEGCLMRLADIDGNGTPEIMTKTCESGECEQFEYWTIYPEAKALVSYLEC
ncbi:MAG: hypothetical protein ACKVQA_09235 [Burkholderiales bacterium]